MTSKRRRYSLLLGIAALVVAIDQSTKQLALEYLLAAPRELIPDVLALRLTFNSGGAFGLFQGYPWVFLLAGVVITTVILVWAGREANDVLVPLGLVLGGGLGNMGDRLFRDYDGHVVDFIELSFWPTFNVADMAIVVGVILIAVAGFRSGPHRAEG